MVKRGRVEQQEMKSKMTWFIVLFVYLFTLFSVLNMRQMRRYLRDAPRNWLTLCSSWQLNWILM